MLLHHPSHQHNYYSSNSINRTQNIDILDELWYGIIMIKINPKLEEIIMPKQKEFYIGCPNCIEPKTTLRDGEHIRLYATSINYGAGCKVVVKCISCEAVQDITNKIDVVSYNEILELLGK